MGDNEGGGTPVYDIAAHKWAYSNPEKQDSLFLFAFIVLIILALVLASVAHRFHVETMPEACIILTVGLVGGVIVKAAYGARQDFFSEALLGFNNSLFFLALLPPIIFNSGWELHPRWLFGLFTPILALAIIGTLTSAIFVGVVLSLASQAGLAPAGITLAETLTFGALISATDPVSVLAVFTEHQVDPKMFYLVFGESVLNDAVGIVLFETFSKYVGYKHSIATLLISMIDFVVIFVGSMLLGAFCAIISAGVLKILRARDDNDAAACHAARKMQVLTVVCSVWFPTFVSYICEMSGIVTTLFAAVGLRHWGLPNLQVCPEEHEQQSNFDGSGEPPSTTSTLEYVDMVLGTLAHLGDTIVFLYLGLSVPANAKQWKEHYSHSLVLWSLLACVVGRAIHVYPICFINNRCFTNVEPENDEDDGAAPLSSGATGATRLSREERKRQKEIPAPMQHMLLFSGLRGAVAFSCAHIFPNANHNRGLFSVTATTVIIVSMYLLGALTTSALKFFGIAKGCTVQRDLSPHTRAGAAPGTTRFWGTLRRLDNWIYPLVVARNRSRAPPLNSRNSVPPSTATMNDMHNDGHGVASDLELVELATNVECRKHVSAVGDV